MSLPVQIAMYEYGPFNAINAVGAVFGISFEAVGDVQLTSFISDPSNQGHVKDRGLWRYTRHPNYFGDACLWWGLYLIAAAHFPGAATVGSPVVMTVLLTRGTGKALMEKSIGERRPHYAEYVRRTSGFVPRPPRHRGP